MTLRARLTAYYILFFALALLVLGVGLYLLAQQILLGSVVDELRIGSALVLDAYRENAEILQTAGAIDIGRLRPPDLHDAEYPELYVQVASPDGAIIAQSSNQRGALLPLADRERRRALSGQEVTTIARAGSVRVLSLIVPLQVGQRVLGVLQVAQSLREIDRSLNALFFALLGGGVIVLLAAARGGLWLARAALEPIDRVNRTAASILRVADLHRRMEEMPSDDELGRLTRTINQMLERLERAVGLQQRFTADVAHELRTPLAAIQGNLEVIRRGALRDPQLLAESLRDIEQEVVRLTRLANDLLALAQADVGMPLRRASVPLDEVAVEVYREMRTLASDVELTVDLQDQVAIVGDHDRLKQALLNLVVNALQHTPGGGTIIISLRRVKDDALLAVTDTGPGIIPAEQALIFERFYRSDQARSSGGAGLGLSIVRWVAEAHGGEALVTSQAHHGTTFTLRLPAMASSDPLADVAAALGTQGDAGTVRSRPPARTADQVRRPQ